jgi:hypothetical protein
MSEPSDHEIPWVAMTSGPPAPRKVPSRLQIADIMHESGVPRTVTVDAPSRVYGFAPQWPKTHLANADSQSSPAASSSLRFASR